MNPAITYSRASIGMHAPIVTVETHISNGLPAFNLVGLPETVVKESKERVRSAILTSHFDFPACRITVNLAPAELPKHGGRYDLAIALGILVASRQLPGNSLQDYEFAGELALSGELRPIPGILSLAIGTRSVGRQLILPAQNANEAAFIKHIAILPANHLLEVCSHLLNKKLLSSFVPTTARKVMPSPHNLKDVKGQPHAKRALEIAAAGQHSLLLIGPPGVGKTLLSLCLPSILPPLNEEEGIELATLQSVAGMPLTVDTSFTRPFRNPHHSASNIALIGGGTPPKPGEISLAHQGVLFLDELPEFKRQALEALREPLECGRISIARANFHIQYPAKFQLIAAMNPCPCGYFGSNNSDCFCSSEKIKNYQGKISGPLLDRLDLQTELQPLPACLITAQESREESSERVATRVLLARERQLSRAQKLNCHLNNQEILQFCKLAPKDEELMQKLINQRNISTRSFHRILKIALTIADLEQASQIVTRHLQEALSYRTFECMKKK
jgi:magnesium chelatase family protein